MKKIFPRAVTVFALALTFTFSGLGHSASAEEKLESGLYFTNPNGTQGEFYNFGLWAEVLTPNEQAKILFKYKPENIFFYVDVTKEIASLKNITQSGSFKTGSKDFVIGDISGEFKDVAKDETIIIGGLVSEEFKVMGIE